MSFYDNMLDKLSHWIADRLEHESSGYEPFTPSDPVTLARTLRQGDVLLVEGNQKVSSAIKYLTQSTWSHAAMYVGDALEGRDHQDSGREGSGAQREDKETLRLIEVNLGEGCVAVPLSKYKCFNTRICRPVGLTPEDKREVVTYMVERLGTKYDTRNIIDLARYLFPTPPIPVRWRRRLIALGSGEPTRAICSTMIAQAFQQVRYPILPRIERQAHEGHEHATSPFSQREILHIRHYSLFSPRDFDISPYFQVIKPTIEFGFDYKALEWSESGTDEGPLGNRRPVIEKAGEQSAVRENTIASDQGTGTQDALKTPSEG